MANLSLQKRQRMLEFLQRLREEHKDDDSVLIALGEIESELNAKKYGLVWEQHEEAVDIMMRDAIPVFTEDTEREITAVPGEAYIFLLEGDNLHSLRLLEKTHKGRIDLIYIENKFNAFKIYAEKHSLHWGFVRDKDNRLYINNTEFAIDMADDHWKPINQVF